MKNLTLSILSAVILLFVCDVHASKKFSFNYKNREIVRVLSDYSEKTGTKFIVDPNIRGRITILFPNEVDDKEAFNALSPFVFQATRALIKLGILAEIEKSGKEGIDLATLSKKLELTEYGVEVLLDMALSAKIIWYNQETDSYIIDKVGHFLLNDEMTRANFDFCADVNYLGLDKLMESVETGKPKGLKVFCEESSTIYPILSQLPWKAKESWFQFDHFYSDISFEVVLNHVFSHQPKVILDVGGNTGKFAKCCLEFDPNVQIIVVDLPSQINVAKANLNQWSNRVRFIECDILSDALPELGEVDLVWMSQFLDCFSQQQIKCILEKVKASTSSDCKILINELFWDKQPHEAAAFVLNATSLYFTAMANGNSRMYKSTKFKQLLADVDLSIQSELQQNTVGGHTLLTCQKGHT